MTRKVRVQAGDTAMSLGQLGVNRDLQLGAGLLLPHRQRAAGNVLQAHATTSERRCAV